MNELVESKITELYNLIMDKPNKILNIFNDFFGESRVDMQGFLNIESFKLWINSVSISTYINEKDLAISNEEWSNNKHRVISELDEEVLEEVLSCLYDYNVIHRLTFIRFSAGYILVHFPNVRITNEYNKYVVIKHLYAKVPINTDGTGEGYFALNRAEYSYLHMRCGYMHSHVASIPTYDFEKFQTPCTGNGPINHTLGSLASSYDEDLWKLFCLELDKYVQVESVAGTPYHRLENLHLGNFSYSKFIYTPVISRDYSKNILKYFTKYLIGTKKLKFNYINNNYSIGMSFVECAILISNLFIEWYNEEFNKGIYHASFQRMIDSKYLKQGIIDGNRIYIETSDFNISHYAEYIGRKICVFKGREIRLSISDLNNTNASNSSIILNPIIICYILTKILNVLNYRYGKSNYNSKGTQEDNTLSEKIKYV